MVRRRTNHRRGYDVAAGKKTVVAVASGVFALAAGIGVAGLASADPSTTPTTSPSGAPSAGVDQPGPGHGGRVEVRTTGSTVTWPPSWPRSWA